MRSGKRALTPDEIRERIRQGYDASSADPDAEGIARTLGYTREQIASLPVGANLGFGCGSPPAHAALQPGEVVVDLGSGAGLDVLLAARAVGPKGRAIGIDMTPHMLEQARDMARRSRLANVEFREAMIEALPLEDGSADVVISNGVINLSPERERVFAEALRVLRPGGRLLISDLAIARPVDPSLARVARNFLGTLLARDDYVAALREAGFREVEVVSEFAYGRLVLSQLAGFRAAALEDGAVDPALERLFDDLTSLHLRGRR